MDCNRFETHVNDLLDARQPLVLDELAFEHQLGCDSCSRLFDVYYQMANLTAGPASKEQLLRMPGVDPSIEAEDLSPVTPTRVSQLISQCLLDNRGTGIDVEEPILAPLAFGGSVTSKVVANSGKNPRDRGRFRSRSSLFTALSLGFCAVVGFTVYRFTVTPDGQGHGLQAGIIASEGPEPKSADRPENPGVADTAIAAANLQQLAESWDESIVDESVVAFDRGWQQIAVGRVRAHQLPGMQPAVYPITGAVEAFRKNMIVRNPNGLAAGLRW